jgi:multifunctional methyltransferase subunit TRM112
MRLLTHNSLRCNRKDVVTGYPLKIHADNIEIREAPCNREFIRDMIPNLNWPALVQATRDIGVDTLPDNLEPELVEDNEFIDALHHILMNIHVVDGRLECPESGHVFQVKNSIADMMLPEDLVP